MQLFDRNKLITKPSASLILLISFFTLMLVGVSMLMQLLTTKMDNTAAALRIGAVLQNVFVFITPAIAVAMLSTRYPASLLAVDKLPSLKFILLAIVALIVSIPAMNVVIDWNMNITLPDSLASLNQYINEFEKSAESALNIMTEGSSVGALIINIIIVGVFAGLGEEIFFRGGMMRLIGCIKGVSPHAAIWIAAFVFSLFHFQFLGFVPRMLLGAFFGYLTYWSGSLWLPILIHSLNNSIITACEWSNANCGTNIDINTLGINSPVIAITSLAITALVIYVFVKLSVKESKK